MNIPTLLPVPQKLTFTGGTVTLPPDAAPAVTLDPAHPHAEGYTLTIAPDGATATAQTQAGAFYAAATMRQLLRHYTQQEVPCLVIEDWPDFPARGVMMDISRDRVPTMDMLRLWIERFAALKINQLQLYIEHTFAFPSHPDVWRDASPLTPDEVRELDALCKAYHIDLVPNQNSFGHMERWLKHEHYADLAIMPEGFFLDRQRPPSTINPLDPRSIELIASIYDDLWPHYTSRLFNAGADEPWELGKGRTEQACKERGKGRVYLDFLMNLYRLVVERGRQMQFWGDIIIHYPDLVPELPKDLIALDWGYESTHDFDGHAAVYESAGVPFYLCPGTSSWNSIAGRTANMLGNVSSAVKAGMQHGAIGILNTDWGDYGHWQPPGVSWPGFAAGAAMSWNTAAHADMTPEALTPLLDAHIYEGDSAAAALALGSVYQQIGAEHINGQLLFFVLQRPLAEMHKEFERVTNRKQPAPDLSPYNLRRVIAQLDDLSSQIGTARIDTIDGDLLRMELTHAAALLQHGAKRLLLWQNAPDVSKSAMLAEWDFLAETQRALWLKRSRPGGLTDSLARFAIARADYE